MFKMLLEIFRRADLLQQACDASIEMLKVDKEMFDEAYKSLRKSDNADLAIDIYEKDAIINKYQREVRRNVLAHLAVSPTKDLVFGLILVSVVIDIERIGDYTKNIVELAQEHPKKLGGGALEKALTDIEEKVSKRFEMLIEAFEKSDDEVARSIMKLHPELTNRCDDIVKSFLKGERREFTTADAVTIALYTRYLKRIGSHISNIASGIVNPFDRIGFKEPSND